MGKNFETMIDLVDEVEHLKEKFAFMGEVTAALAIRTDTAGLGDTAFAGLCQINTEIENQFDSLSKALNYDFHVIKKSAKEVHVDNFCGTVEAGIQTDVSRT